MSADYVDGRWPLEFLLVQILSEVCIFPNLILSADYDNIRCTLEFPLVQILILIVDYGDRRWPQEFVFVQILMRFLFFKIDFYLFPVPSILLRTVNPSCTILYKTSPPPNNHTSNQPTYVAVGVLSAPLSVLGGGGGLLYSHCLRDHPCFLPAVNRLCMYPGSIGPRFPSIYLRLCRNFAADVPDTCRLRQQLG